MEMKHFRVKTTPDGSDNYLTIDLKQNFDILDVLSLRINKTDFYRSYSSDFGVVVGRVNVNEGFGVPNAKLSIFIPITDEDMDNEKIFNIYPYTSVNDTNDNGVRYNLFTPREDYPLGTFPTKQEIVDSELLEGVYRKYYKYTTVTNESGDYMLFGVPIGLHTLHMDLDLSDIGDHSFTPSDIISTGYPESAFNTDGRGFYSFKAKSDLSTLPQVISQDMTIDVKPLWGSTDEEVGITRYDFNSNLQVYNYATVAFSLAIDPQRHYKDKGILWEHDYEELGLYNSSSDGMSNENLPGKVNRIRPVVMNEESGEVFGSPYFKVYRVDDKGEMYEISDYNIVTPPKGDENGMMIVKLPCYDDKYITDEYGNNVISRDERGLGTTGQYVIDVICNHIGMLDRGGEYYNFRLTEKPFTFNSSSIYTVAWQMTKNKGGYYGLRGTTRIGIGGFMGIQVYDTSNGNLTTYQPKMGDWINGCLYFGRMGNDSRSKYKEATIPHDLRRDIGGQWYYAVPTSIIDITNLINPTTEVDTNMSLGKVNGGIWVGDEKNVYGFKKLLDRGTNSTLNNSFILMGSCNTDIGNNFKNYKKLIG